MSDIVRKRIRVSGVVQGVWFRASAREKALEHGVSGWVRNLGNGDVEAVLEGPEADVDAVVAWSRSGPPRARVESVEVQPETPEGLSGFSVR